MERRHRHLRVVMTIDGWLSFTIPPAMLAGLPLLVILDVPGWLLATTVLVLAGVLAGCGLLMAGVLAVDAARGHLEFPVEVLAGVGGADWEEMPARPSP